MKSLLFIMLLLSQQVAWAMPYTCESEEMLDGKPVLRFRVNPKVPVEQNGTEWNLYLVGVTPAKGFRKIVYGSGSADKKSIAMTFVKDSFVLGSVIAEAHKDGMYYGEAQLDRLKVSVKCVDNKK